MTTVLESLLPALLLTLGWAAAVRRVWRFARDDRASGGGGPGRRGDRTDPPGPAWPTAFGGRRAGPSDLAGSA
jgi:hypothetical protein